MNTEHFENEYVRKLDLQKFSHSLTKLSGIPKGYDPDEVNLRIVFNTHSHFVQPQDTPLRDTEGQIVEGVQVLMSMSKIHTGRSSLKGLIRLSEDPRVFAVAVAKPV